MVSKVLAWKAAHAEEASALWNEINSHNHRVAETFGMLQQCDPARFDECAALPAAQWEQQGGSEGKLLHQLREAFVGSRRGLKRMGELAGVPIEPDEQTELCDASMQAPGVVVCGVPGAGGQDAVVAVVIGSAAPLQQLWQGWKKATVLAMLVRENPRGLVVDH